MAEDKANVLRQVYYDETDGFSSVYDTYKQANKILHSITLQDTKEWLEKQKLRQARAYHGYNSYVASEPLQEIQQDVADFIESGAVNHGYRYLFVAVDMFTKYCHAVPIKNKQSEESVRAMQEVLSVIGYPKTIYHDNEGAWNSKLFLELLKSHNIKQIVTSSPPPFAERMVQTIKHGAR